MEKLAGLLGFRFSSVELADAMDVMDTDHTDRVNFEQFFLWWKDRHERGDLEIHNEAVGVFNKIDADGNGTLDTEEVRVLGKMLNFDWGTGELEAAMREMDSDGDGRIDFHEFYRWWLVRKQRNDFVLHNEAVALFEKVDDDKNGFLDPSEVVELGKLMDYHFTEGELQPLVDTVAISSRKNNNIDFAAFYSWFAKFKQRGTLMQLGELATTVSVNAQVQATTERLKNVTDAMDPSEIHAALDSARETFALCPATPEAMGMMSSLKKRFQSDRRL